MRRMTLLAGVIFALGVLVPGSGLAGQGGGDLPLKGSGSGTCTTNLVTGVGGCLTTDLISHFGLSTVEQDALTVPTGPDTFIWRATATTTAANGDQMSFVGTGTTIATDSSHFLSRGRYTSTGGTGRFAEATETLDATIHLTVVSVEGAILTTLARSTYVGTLSWGS